MPFACIYIPNFMVQVTERAEPELASRPLAIVEGTTSSLVVAMNALARKDGVEPGMTAVQAAQFPSMEIRQRFHAQEDSAHAALLDLGFSFSPRLEDAAVDTILIDLVGLESLLGSPEEAAHQMSQRAGQLGFQAQIAVASNPEAALHAARCFEGITIIPPGQDSLLLKSAPLSFLTQSVEILHTFNLCGVRTFGALAALPTAQLSERLGQEGVRLQALARGESLRPLVPTQPRLQFEEEMELEHPLDQLDSMLFALGLMLNRLVARLEARALAIQELFLGLEMEASGEEDQPVTEGRYETRLRLPLPTQKPKILLKLLQIHLSTHPPSGPVVKLRLVAEPAKPRAAQGGLFLPTSPDPEKLELTLARLGKIVGEGNVGSPEVLDTHRLDAVRLTRFNPFEACGGSRIAKPQGNSTPAEHPTERARIPQAALRIFRPPLPARVQTRDGLPVWISFAGMRGRIVYVTGPWRTSGDWWTDQGWQHDEWDAEVRIDQGGGGKESDGLPRHASALYRLAYDLVSVNWFVRGSYD